jgi:glucose-6-phosphate 1-dehydrogenase
MTIRIDPEKLHAPVARARETEPCALVIFGGSGDLSKRKLIPALYNLERDGTLPEGVPIVGVGLEPWTRDVFRATHKEATGKFSRSKPLDEKVWERFAGRLDYVSGDLGKPETYASLRARLEAADREHGCRGNRLFYCAVPASVFPIILKGLVEAGLIRHEEDPAARPFSRVVIE